jgi:hypothetical protein
MKAAALALVAVVGFLLPQTAAPKPFDPAGKWSFSTVQEDGSAVTGTLEITGTPGAYQGQAVLPDGTSIPISDVMTSPSGFMAVADLPQGAALIKLVKGQAEGSFTGAWGQIQQSYNITAKKIGG